MGVSTLPTTQTQVLHVEDAGMKPAPSLAETFSYVRGARLTDVAVDAVFAAPSERWSVLSVN